MIYAQNIVYMYKGILMLVMYVVSLMRQGAFMFISKRFRKILLVQKFGIIDKMVAVFHTIVSNRQNGCYLLVAFEVKP